LSVYPNPTSGSLHIQEATSGQFRDAQISVYDLSGREVFLQNGYNSALDVSRIKTGTYILQLITETGHMLTERVVIQ
ncbi:MAG: T9SS type A sorting domain-containing protein, partial [Flavobacteriales bacterium]